ncbi:MAG TPA: glycosyltransferase [Flavitalea sp.]|nr:glycosyltransferase [Flavitalea sp.]
MTKKPLIYFAVYNNLSHDQRMIRICQSLTNNGFEIAIVGTSNPRPAEETPPAYRRYRLACIFHKGKTGYAEFNLRLFFFLLFRKMDGICAIDLDTIVPVFLVSAIKRVKRFYDAHELFCEMQEVVSRPAIYNTWKWVERNFVPRFKHGYTVNEPIAAEFRKLYGMNYLVIRNLPVLRQLELPEKNERFILYQGAVNEGRSFETLIPAMKEINARLFICGDGNFMSSARSMVAEQRLEDKIIFTGMLLPEALRTISLQAWIGINVLSNSALSIYYSLANRFFDYMHAGLPQVCIDFPAYRQINDQYGFAELIPDNQTGTIEKAINGLLEDEQKYFRLQQHCMSARNELNWDQEEKILIDFYQQQFQLA